ncbi:MAG TPA: hypothetical protein VEW04_06895 [Allosphingosinicella sp.]|nr:hypothetical protein [Allosphingosinicella sp.]
MRVPFALALILASFAGTEARAQVYPAGSFSVDGYPVVCYNVTFVVDPSLPDVGMSRPGYIFLNPHYFVGLPTSLKLFWVGHECGHHVVGLNETAADCWAVRTGRDQGWFSPDAFYGLMEMFRNNPGDIVHPPGPARVAAMIQCYQQ